MIDLDSMSDDDKLAALESIHKSIAESKEIQKQKIAANVDLVLQALKKMEADIRSRFDETGKVIEKRVANIKDGRDGRNGVDGKPGRDGRNGIDGADGPRGLDGLNGVNGIDGEDGVSVSDARIDFDGSLIITLSNGRELNVGEVVSQDVVERLKIITSGGAGGGGGSGTVTSVAISGGTTGLTTSGGPITTAGTVTLGGTLAVANGGTGTATPSIVAGTNITVTGTWPNQTVTASGGSGSVTSVAATVPAFLSVAGSPITTSGTLAISLSGTALPVANGGTGDTTASGARANLLPAYATNAGKVLAVNAGSTDVEYITVGGTGTVTSVAGTGTVNGITLTGTVTSAGSLTLGGTLSGVDLTTQVTGTLPVANGGTGITSLGTGVATALGVNVGSAGAPVTFNGALGTPSSGTLTSATGLPLTTGVTGTLPAANGGTGVANNAAMTVTGSGNFAYTRTLTGTTNVTFPTTGTLATLAGTETLTNKTVEAGTFTNGYTEEVHTATISAGAITLSLVNGTVQFITFGAASATITMPTAAAGKSFTLFLKQDSVGSRSATWSTVSWPSATAPTLTTTANKLDKFVFTSDGTSWFGSTAGQNYT